MIRVASLVDDFFKIFLIYSFFFFLCLYACFFHFLFIFVTGGYILSVYCVFEVAGGLTGEMLCMVQENDGGRSVSWERYSHLRELVNTGNKAFRENRLDEVFLFPIGIYLSCTLITGNLLDWLPLLFFSFKNPFNTINRGMSFG